MTTSMARNRKCAIVAPKKKADVWSSDEACAAWDRGDVFEVLQYDGPGRNITKEQAIAEGLAEVTIRFGNRQQAVDVRLVPVSRKGRRD